MKCELRTRALRFFDVTYAFFRHALNYERDLRREGLFILFFQWRNVIGIRIVRIRYDSIVFVRFWLMTSSFELKFCAASKKVHIFGLIIFIPFPNFVTKWNSSVFYVPFLYQTRIAALRFVSIHDKTNYLSYRT